MGDQAQNGNQRISGIACVGKEQTMFILGERFSLIG
jgi:hypothetical protein